MADIERAELLRTWVAALRSGKYRQIRHKVHLGGGFCAVGVLLDIGRGDMAWEPSEDRDMSETLPDGAFKAISEAAAQERFGLAISRMNDMGASFSAIADEIERRHPDVFGEKVERGEGVEDAYLGADASALDKELAVA